MVVFECAVCYSLHTCSRLLNSIFGYFSHFISWATSTIKKQLEVYIKEKLFLRHYYVVMPSVIMKQNSHLVYQRKTPIVKVYVYLCKKYRLLHSGTSKHAISKCGTAVYWRELARV